MSILCALLMMLASHGLADNRKPIWNIGHMVNSIKQIDTFINGTGVNAIEVDVTYGNRSGSNSTFYLYHGALCDIGRWCKKSSEIEPYLDQIRARVDNKSTVYNANLSLIYFDNKLQDGMNYTVAGRDLAHTILKHLFPTASEKIYVMIGTDTIERVSFFKSFHDTITNSTSEYVVNRIGYEFSNEISENPAVIIKAFASVGITKNIWLSKGITNAVPENWYSYDFTNFCAARDNDSSPVTKVYGWTVDYEATMEDWMYVSLDGVITNHVDNLADVLQYPSLNTTHRLATPDDNPFEKYPYNATYRYKGCDYRASAFYYYCWVTCGKYPQANDYCWTDVRCGNDAMVCQDPGVTCSCPNTTSKRY